MKLQPAIDWNILRGATDGDETAMKEVVALYLRLGPKNLKELRSAVVRKDPTQVAALAHRFLGSSRFIGATEMGTPLAALVKMGRSRRLSSAAAGLVDRTEEEFVRIDQYLKLPHE